MLVARIAPQLIEFIKRYFGVRLLLGFVSIDSFKAILAASFFLASSPMDSIDFFDSLSS